MTVLMRIYHFDDEPEGVPFPTLLDAHIQRQSGVTACNYVCSDDETRHLIRCCHFGRSLAISYELRQDVDGVRARSLRAAILHISDISFGGQRHKGLDMVQRLIAIGVDPENIWIVSGYATYARTSLGPMHPKLRILSKPIPSYLVCDDVWARIMKRLDAHTGGD
jgi:hypothetical protein